MLICLLPVCVGLFLGIMALANCHWFRCTGRAVFNTYAFDFVGPPPGSVLYP